MMKLSVSSCETQLITLKKDSIQGRTKKPIATAPLSSNQVSISYSAMVVEIGHGNLRWTVDLDEPVLVILALVCGP